MVRHCLNGPQWKPQQNRSLQWCPGWGRDRRRRSHGRRSLPDSAQVHHWSITGCVRSADETNTVTDENDKVNYTLVDGASQLKTGDRVKLQGKKRKISPATALFG